MKWLAVSTRVTEESEYAEFRDSLDQRWFPLLRECGLLPLLVPNYLPLAKELLLATPPAGILLTGGGDLKSYGGTNPERDEVEGYLLAHALERKIPVLGVCRGMQFLLHHFGTKLERIEGHVAEKQTIHWNGKNYVTNSYHRLGTHQAPKEFEVTATADDGVVKAIRHRTLPLHGIMWHPERRHPSSDQDRKFISSIFGA